VRRTVIPELLDTDSGTAEEVAASLADLRWFNRYFGGQATTAALIKSVAAELPQTRRLSVLDVASASADNLLARDNLLDTELAVTVLDRSPQHLPKNGRAIKICGDALALPFRDCSFDLVACSLFIHHLEPEAVVAFATEALRVGRYAVLINDLVRSPLHLAAAIAGKALYRSRLTRHDAPASVRRAYTPSELQQILNRIGARRIVMSRHYFCRMGFVLWR
jgi:ubiquinone/menaquinone biosynthesis C-methylase UbiE